MDLKIRTLSPVYIGTGEDFNAMSYMVDGCKVKFYDLRGIMYHIPQKKRDQFVELIGTSADRSLESLMKRVFGEMPSWLDSYCVCTLPLAGNLNSSSIRAFIAEGKDAYIPGTEVKGAIRTAMLYYFLNPDLHDEKSNMRSFSEDLLSFLKKQIDKEERLTVRRLKDIEKEFEQKAFRKDVDSDAKYDLLKYLMVRDSQPKPVEECLFVSNTKVLNVHKRKWRKSGRIIFPCQFCRENQVFISQDMRISDVPEELGLSEEQRWMLQFADQTPNFFRCCHEFSSKFLDEEINYFNCKDRILEMDLFRNNLGGISKEEAEKILAHVVERLEEIKAESKSDAPVVRLGGSQGYFGTTAILASWEVYKEVAYVLAKDKQDPLDFPRTRRSVLTLDDEYDTIGWVQLSAG